MYDIFLLTAIFFKIALFSFGGGYAMLSIIEAEVLKFNIIDSMEFANVVALSQMSPGPIAVNAATYVGYRYAGIWGSVFATIAVCLPSFILIMIISSFFEKFKNNEAVKGVLKGIRPVIIGMIMSVVLFFANTIIFDKTVLNSYVFKGLNNFYDRSIGIIQMFIVAFNIPALIIALLTLILALKYKINPIYLIITGGVLGGVFL